MEHKVRLHVVVMQEQAGEVWFCRDITLPFVPHPGIELVLPPVPGDPAKRETYFAVAEVLYTVSDDWCHLYAPREDNLGRESVETLIRRQSYNGFVLNRLHGYGKTLNEGGLE